MFTDGGSVTCLNTVLVVDIFVDDVDAADDDDEEEEEEEGKRRRRSTNINCHVLLSFSAPFFCDSEARAFTSTAAVM